MSVPYLMRLLCVCLACFFLLHLAFASVARLLIPWLLRRAERLAGRDSARSAALLLLSFRLMPALLALVTVASLCLPSFISLESERGAELAGMPFLAIAALGGAVWGMALWRGARALLRSQRSLRGQAHFETGAEQVWVWEGPTPFLGLAGVFRPRVVLSRSVAQALDADQLAAALRHERAHRESSDNLKRLLLLLAPEACPGMRLFPRVDRAWARYTEWAADDRAVGQDPARSVSLAEALVRVARLGAGSCAAPLVSPFVPDCGDIRARVERLLSGRCGLPGSRRAPDSAMIGALALLPVLAAVLAPGSLGAVHGLIEGLMH